MTWLPMILLALAAFAVMVFGLRLPRSHWALAGAALVAGLAGYALQGRPGLAGSPRAPQQSVEASAAALVAERQQMAGDTAGQPASLLVTADALARHGQFANAAGLLLGVVEKDPANAEAWLAMANSLIGHADGFLTPAALHAYERAQAASPGHPGPPFFLGAALIRSGRAEQGRAMWAELLARTPPEAPWHDDLEARLAQLDAMLAEARAAPAPR
jgi:cytochrome c-type biogenesis protein CcmH